MRGMGQIRISKNYEGFVRRVITARYNLQGAWTAGDGGEMFVSSTRSDSIELRKGILVRCTDRLARCDPCGAGCERESKMRCSEKEGAASIMMMDSHMASPRRRQRRLESEIGTSVGIMGLCQTNRPARRETEGFYACTVMVRWRAG